jgi:hypothetical protein
MKYFSDPSDWTGGSRNAAKGNTSDPTLTVTRVSHQTMLHSHLVVRGAAFLTIERRAPLHTKMIMKHCFTTSVHLCKLDCKKGRQGFQLTETTGTNNSMQEDDEQ